MDNDSNQVQDYENNDSAEQSLILLSLERHRSEEKDSLAKRKQESQSRVTKRKKKSRKRKVSTNAKDWGSSSIDSSLPPKKRKPNVSDIIINRHRHLFQLPVIQVLMRKQIMTGLKLSLKMKNLNGNYPKVWPTTQRNILKSTIQRIV